MRRKSPSSRKQKPRQELAEDTAAALAAVAGTFDEEGRAPPSFTPEGYTPLTEAVTSIEGGWEKLRQHLHAGRVQGFIWTEQGRLVPVPAEDWGSPENDEAGQTGRAIKLNRAIVGRNELRGFALVKTSDLALLRMQRIDNIIGTGEQNTQRRGRKKGSGSLASKDMPLIQELDRLVRVGEVPSPWAAAQKLAIKAAGTGTPESKVRRLHVRFRKWKNNIVP